MKKFLIGISLFLLASSALGVVKKVVFISWYTAEMRPESIVQNINYIETLPFDGITVSADQAFDVMTPGFSCDYNTVSASMNQVKGIFTKVTDNYAMVYVKEPGDFFDDAAWNRVIANWGIFARACKAAGLKGICFDNEPYFSKPWGYPEEVDHADQYTLQQYMAQARKRGNQVMQACLKEFPDIKIWSFHGPYVSENVPSWFQTQQLNWKLMGSFFVGMVEPTVGTSAINVDGGEIYSIRTREQFQAQYDWNKYTIQSAGQNSPNISATLRPYWSERVEISYGIWLSLQNPGIDNMDENIMRPTLENALNVVDEFVWLYVEESGATGWLTPAGQSYMAPYLPAIIGAKNAVNVNSDPTPPTAPTNLTVSNLSPTTATISWTASTDNIGVIGYDVFIDGVSAGRPTSTTINLTSLTCETSYSITAKARDAGNNWSASSAPLPITTSACVPGAENVINDNNTRIAYSGAWESGLYNTDPGNINKDEHLTNATDASASLTFTGSSISWIGTSSANRGIVDVYIDNVKTSTVDAYSSAFSFQEVLYTNTSLSSGSHTIKLVNTGTKNTASSGTYLIVDAFKYTNPSTTRTIGSQYLKSFQQQSAFVTAQGMITINLSSPDLTRVRISDANGRLVYSTIAAGKLIMPASAIKPGVYFVNKRRAEYASTATLILSK